MLGVVDTLGKLPDLGNLLLRQLNNAITGTGETKDSLYLTDKVGNILFAGSKPGSITWLFNNIDNIVGLLEGLGLSEEVLENLISLLLPPVLDRENGFAVFNNKNATTDME